jgi:hypothetical protein
MVKVMLPILPILAVAVMSFRMLSVSPVTKAFARSIIAELLILPPENSVMSYSVAAVTL